MVPRSRTTPRRKPKRSWCTSPNSNGPQYVPASQRAEQWEPVRIQPDLERIIYPVRTLTIETLTTGPAHVERASGVGGRTIERARGD